MSLPQWNKETDYLLQLANTVKSTKPKLWIKLLKKWIVALVGCAIDENTINQTALIFIGEQGIGKTTWLTKLVPQELKRYYYEGPIRTGSKDAMIQISETFLINLDEMENAMKGDGTALKQLITQTTVAIRKPYTRDSISIPRRTSFTGSINHKSFLNDSSGNRRYLCIEVSDFNNQHSN